MEEIQTMAKLVFDQAGQHFYETGVKNVVLYVKKDGKYGTGVAWNGVTAISENPSGAEATPLYADDIKYLNLVSKEDFGATIEAYTYPDEFMECDGSAKMDEGVTYGQQPRSTFGLCYKTTVGNEENSALGYKLHLLYGCLAAPSEKSYATINDSPEAITFSWEVTTTPEKVDAAGTKFTSIITVDSTKVSAAKLAALEAKLYGGDGESDNAKLPTPEEVATLLASTSDE